MRALVDIALVLLAVGAACLYAFLKLAPRDLRRRVAARLGRRASAVANAASCGGCDDCGDAAKAAPNAAPDVRIAPAEIQRRR